MASSSYVQKGNIPLNAFQSYWPHTQGVTVQAVLLFYTIKDSPPAVEKRLGSTLLEAVLIKYSTAVPQFDSQHGSLLVHVTVTSSL